MKVLMLEERLKTKDFEHFGNPFTATGVAGLIHGRILMTAEESANGDKACCKYGNGY
jgi:hypothetical protein